MYGDHFVLPKTCRTYYVHIINTLLVFMGQYFGAIYLVLTPVVAEGLLATYKHGLSG